MNDPTNIDFFHHEVIDMETGDRYTETDPFCLPTVGADSDYDEVPQDEGDWF